MATAIDVILTEDSIAGKAGELTKVKPGFARNFLLPRNLAKVADVLTLQEYYENKAEIERLAAEKREQAEKDKENIGEEASVTISSKAGETGKLFGAITKEKIALAASEEFKLTINKENIRLKSPIKTVGEHKVNMHLGSNINTQITVKVIPEQ